VTLKQREAEVARLALSQQSSRQTSPPTTRREMKPISISPVVPPRVAAGTRGRYDFALVGKRPVLGGSTLAVAVAGAGLACCTVFVDPRARAHSTTAGLRAWRGVGAAAH
jgi:hypothetical protein